MLYDDGRIACSDTEITIRHYYFWGTAKAIPYRSVRDVNKRPLTRFTGKWRIWGTSDFVHWWNFDPDRPKKDTALELDVGGRIRPTITPDDAEAVAAILRTHMD